MSKSISIRAFYACIYLLCTEKVRLDTSFTVAFDKPKKTMTVKRRLISVLLLSPPPNPLPPPPPTQHQLPCNCYGYLKTVHEEKEDNGDNNDYIAYRYKDEKSSKKIIPMKTKHTLGTLFLKSG